MPLKLVQRQTLTDVIETLTRGPQHAQDVTGHFITEARPSVTDAFPEDLHPPYHELMLGVILEHYLEQSLKQKLLLVQSSRHCCRSWKSE